MRPKRGCAVIAAAFRPEGDALAARLKEMGFSRVVSVQDGVQALESVRRFRPDALVADAVLPGIDGVSLLEKVEETPLTVYPSSVLLTPPGVAVRGRNGRIILEKPVTCEALETALAALSPEKRPVPDGKRLRAESLLDSLGIPEHPGREYLLRAIYIVWQDSRYLSSLTAGLYPVVAEEFGVKSRQAERAMRHVIDVAWRNGEIEAQYAIFGDTIDARRGNPTCGEMIAQIADILRWEGNA